MSRWLIIIFARCLRRRPGHARRPGRRGRERHFHGRQRLLTKLEQVSTARQVGTKLEQVGSTVTDRASDLVVTAMGFLGVPYRRGGTTAETGFDCSGFVRAMYEKTIGLVLPRRANEQAAATQKIDKKDLQPGDLVFFNTMRRAFSHVGIYVGEGKFIHSPKPGAQVRVEDMGAELLAAALRRRAPRTDPSASRSPGKPVGARLPTLIRSFAAAARPCRCRARSPPPCRCSRPASDADGWSCRCPPRPRPSRWPARPR